MTSIIDFFFKATILTESHQISKKSDMMIMAKLHGPNFICVKKCEAFHLEVITSWLIVLFCGKLD